MVSPHAALRGDDDALRVQRSPDGLCELHSGARGAFGYALPRTLWRRAFLMSVGVFQRASASRVPPLLVSLSPTERSSAGDTASNASRRRLAILVVSAARSMSRPSGDLQTGEQVRC